MWIVQPGSDEKILRLRPVDGSDDENTVIVVNIEPEVPRSATFDWPDASKHGPDLAGTMLLKDALTLKLKNGAGAFRSFGAISVEPKAYQLVPLLMALRQDTVRLLIADDVGVGKTIEAGLILREFIDRGEVTKAAVLCPPHLCDQWRTELKERFHIDAKTLTPRTVGALERSVAAGTLFDFYKFIIVSLDYIKSDEHRQHFISSAPDFLIVDEAHTCASAGTGTQQRYQLLKELSKKKERNILLLTATPHSGNEKGFYSLLSLLDPKYLALAVHGEKTPEAKKLRDELGGQLVQRRRKDIAEWRDSAVFPRRFQKEITYKLTGEWGNFFDDVRAYCAEMALKYDEGSSIIWYATLGLLRCAASSPDAALSALGHRLERLVDGGELASSEDRFSVFDEDCDPTTADDIEPAARDESISKLHSLINTAGKLAKARNDPKFAALLQHIEELLSDGFHPVVFCRYIATAKYVGERLAASLPQAGVFVVTGEQTPEERMARVEESSDAPVRVLVATDCLSEGINLQEHYNAVAHYDLSWNPTRHEQREGRIDRFGQTAPEVRCAIIYGEDNPIDGFVLRVILRKTKTIRDELGVYIQPPEEKEKIERALIKAALMKRRNGEDSRQGTLFPGFDEEPVISETGWKDMLAAAKTTHTIFAQNSIHPEKVAEQLRRQNEYLGTDAEVENFVCSVCTRLGVPPKKRGAGYSFFFAALPDRYKRRIEAAGIPMTPFTAGFTYPVAEGEFIHRSHPLVSILGDILLESVLHSGNLRIASRSSATPVAGIDARYAIFILRLRHKLTYSNTRRGEDRVIVAEELLTLGMKLLREPEFFTDKALLAPLLAARPAADITNETATAQINAAKEMLRKHSDELEHLARDSANKLLKEHREVRDSAGLGGTWRTEACLPVDVMGVSVLIPAL